MNRALIMIALSILLAATGCGGFVSEIAVKGGGPGDVEKGSADVIITVPASMVNPHNIEATVAEARAQGVDEAAVNKDGSVTYRMSRSVHARMMKELKEGFRKKLEDLKNDSRSIKIVRYSRDLSSITLTVDQEAFKKSLDAFAVFSLAMDATYYQLFSGVELEDIAVRIDITDLATGEVFDSATCPHVLEAITPTGLIGIE